MSLASGKVARQECQGRVWEEERVDQVPLAEICRKYLLLPTSSGFDTRMQQKPSATPRRDQYEKNVKLYWYEGNLNGRKLNLGDSNLLVI